MAFPIPFFKYSCKDLITVAIFLKESVLCSKFLKTPVYKELNEIEITLFFPNYVPIQVSVFSIFPRDFGSNFTSIIHFYFINVKIP